MGKVIRALEKMFPHADDDSRTVQENFRAADGTTVEVAHDYSYYDPSDTNGLMPPMNPPTIDESGHVSLTPAGEDVKTHTLRFVHKCIRSDMVV
jgi:hypothetical protein